MVKLQKSQVMKKLEGKHCYGLDMKKKKMKR